MNLLHIDGVVEPRRKISRTEDAEEHVEEFRYEEVIVAVDAPSRYASGCQIFLFHEHDGLAGGQPVPEPVLLEARQCCGKRIGPHVFAETVSIDRVVGCPLWKTANLLDVGVFLPLDHKHLLTRYNFLNLPFVAF